MGVDEVIRDLPRQYAAQLHLQGAFTPQEATAQRNIVVRMSDYADANLDQPLEPCVQEFKELIENDPMLYMYFTGMFEEVPFGPLYWRDPLGMKVIRDYKHMLQILSRMITTAPDWSAEGVKTGYVAAPMCALLVYPLCTRSGHAAFLNKDVNRVLKKILNTWGTYLSSPISRYTLDSNRENGWFTPEALQSLVDTANAPYDTNYTFEQLFVCDPSKPHRGYQNWDHFFTREIYDAVRPVASPHDDDVIVNACESEMYNLQYNAKLRDRFFAKGEPYSVTDMLANDALAPQFEGATVYQAFLSALSYHRWHSPVSGVIRKAFVEDGTFFSQRFFPDELPHWNQFNVSQGYLSAMATRAIIFIEADNPKIGLMAFIGIGMDEISSCDITVSEGQHVKKGDQLGMFHYGGSSHCLLFRNEVELEGFPAMGKNMNEAVKGKLAVVKGNRRLQQQQSQVGI